MGAIWLSVRHRAESIGSLAGRLLFTVIVFLVLLMVDSVFAVSISSSFVATPSSVVPAWGAIAVAAVIGQCIYRLRWNLPIVSAVGVIVLYSLIFCRDRVAGPAAGPFSRSGSGGAVDSLAVSICRRCFSAAGLGPAAAARLY